MATPNEGHGTESRSMDESVSPRAAKGTWNPCVALGNICCVDSVHGLHLLDLRVACQRINAVWVGTAVKPHQSQLFYVAFGKDPEILPRIYTLCEIDALMNVSKGFVEPTSMTLSKQQDTS